MQVPNLRRIQYTHKRLPSDQPAQQTFIQVETDAGITGRCTTTMSPAQAAILRVQVLGEEPTGSRKTISDVAQRETRWVYQPPGWFGDFDNCLWDIAGKAAGLPVYALVGRVREQFPVYLTGGDGTVADYLRAIEAGREIGINAYKFHSYKGGKADIPILREVRETVGT